MKGKGKCICIVGISMVVYLFLKYLAPVVAPMLLALLFVTICGPFLLKLQKLFHLPRQVGAGLLLSVVGAVLLIFAGALISWMGDGLYFLMDNVGEYGEHLTETLHEIGNSLGAFFHLDSSFLEKWMTEGINGFFAWVKEELIPGVLTHSLVYVKGAAYAGGFAISFMIAVILLAADYDRYMNYLLEREECEGLLRTVCGVIRYLATFIKAQIILLSCIGGICAVVLRVAGISQGILWGLLAGVLDALPFIGTGVVLVPMGIYQLVKGNFVRAAVCVILYIGCIFLRQWLEPKLIGKKTGLPPIIILTALYAGIRLFGLPGIVEGPLGVILIRQIYRNFTTRDEVGYDNSET